MAARGVRSRWWALVDRVRSSLWAMPFGMMLMALALAAVTIALDREQGHELSQAWWLLRAGAEGTRETLSVISGSVMTVTGVAFSTTIVVLQLASSQYSPRVVRNFRRDRLIQGVLGAFTATFVYALAVLRTIATSDEGPSFTAPISVTVAMALGFVCMILLVALVHHIAHSVQVNTILHAISHETRETMDRLYPEDLGEPAAPERDPTPPERADAPWNVRAGRSGYVGFVDSEAFDLRGAELAMIEVRVGDFVREGDVIARVWPASAERDSSNGDVAAAIRLGAERTMRQDIRYGFRLLVDIALRALSPSLNDPTTAVHCVDAISALLCTLVRRRVPEPLRRSTSGLRIYAHRPSFAEILSLAFDEIVDAAHDSPPVLLAVAAALTAIASRDPEGAHRGALDAVAARIEHACSCFGEWTEIDRERVRAAAAAIRR